jgi:hypothetical protein
MNKPSVVVVAVALLICGATGYAAAQQATDSAAKTIRACAQKKGGALRLASKCRKGERRVTWAQAGLRGSQGATGATGAAGTPGKDGAGGAAGPPGPGGSAGANGVDGTNGTNGTPGVNGNTTGETLFASAGPGSNVGTGPCAASPNGGPTVTFTAVTGTYVQVMVSAGMQRTGGTANSVCLHVDADDIPILASTAVLVETRYLQTGSSGGVTDPYAARPITFPVSAGSHTISLRYGSTGGASQFTNRNLYVTVFHPTS